MLERMVLEPNSIERGQSLHEPISFTRSALDVLLLNLPDHEVEISLPFGLKSDGDRFAFA